ncbi:MAG: hypothetical protein ACO4B5_09695 [Steroidobacteraceae bacterium]
MASQIQSRWVYPLVGVTTQKTLPRVATDTRAAFELTGVDGSLRGGIRPFPGFIKGHTFLSGTGEVSDYCLFELRLDADSAAHGVAYLRGGALYVDINFPVDGWTTQTVKDAGAEGPLEAVAWGKVVYIFCRGLPPIAIRGYRKDDADNIGVVDPAGPGDPPRAALTTVPLLDNTATDSWTMVDTDGDEVPDDLNADGLALTLSQDSLGITGAQTLASGNYAFAYSFYDSRTGRRSQLSEVVEVTEDDFTGASYARWQWHTAAIPAQNPPPYLIPKRFTDRWDRLYLWRSVRVEGAGGTYVAAILHLDKIYPFFFSIPDLDPEGGINESEQASNYTYTLKDTSLVTQDVRLDRSSLYATMPRGGTATILNDVMYVADIVPDPIDETDNGEEQPTVNQDVYPDEALQGVGEIRWSQPLDPHPELFHWSGRHMPSTVTERPLRLLTVGEAVIAMSRNRAMVIRRQGSIVLVDEIHEGYGLVSRNSCAAVSDSVWFLSDKGLKKVTVTGVLADVPILDELVVQNWEGTLGQCSLSFDHRAGCLWILNPALDKAVCLWMETGMLTELEELPFSAVRSGMWPNYEGVNIRRSVFLKGDSLWLVDHDREVGGVRLLKVDGECDLTVEVVTGDVVRLSPHIDYKAAVEEGMVIHRIGLVPGRWRVVEVVTAAPSYTDARLVPLQPGGMPEQGDAVVASPVVLRWSGGILGGVTEEGQGFLNSSDMFRSRQLSSVGCVFDSVDGTGHFRGCAFFGTTLEPTHYGHMVPIQSVGGLPTDYSAFGTYGVSHSSLSPGVEVLCADLDFRLLSVVCRGRVDASDRAR